MQAIPVHVSTHAIPPLTLGALHLPLVISVFCTTFVSTQCYGNKMCTAQLVLQQIDNRNNTYRRCNSFNLASEMSNHKQTRALRVGWSSLRSQITLTKLDTHSNLSPLAAFWAEKKISSCCTNLTHSRSGRRIPFLYLDQYEPWNAQSS